MILLSNIIVCVCASIGFIYGVVKFVLPRKALYARMIALAVGCTAFGKLYQIVRLLTIGDIGGEFQLGFLGIIGSLVFLFSANFGVMDSIADDGSKANRKYRIIPIVAPVAAVAVYVFVFLLGDFSLLIKVIAGAIAFFVAQSSYFNLKHLIFPDVEYGVIQSLRLYNLLALIFDFLCLAEMIAYSFENEIMEITVHIMTAILLLLMTPVVERGMKRWTT